MLNSTSGDQGKISATAVFRLDGTPSRRTRYIDLGLLLHDRKAIQQHIGSLTFDPKHGSTAQNIGSKRRVKGQRTDGLLYV